MPNATEPGIKMLTQTNNKPFNDMHIIVSLVVLQSIDL
jgi:hypothetical protein